MINIYKPVTALVLRHRVNGKDGFVILPEGDDDSDGIYFEDFDTLKAWIEAIAGQVVTVANPDEIESYDDWAERVNPDA